MKASLIFEGILMAEKTLKIAFLIFDAEQFWMFSIRVGKLDVIDIIQDCVSIRQHLFGQEKMLKTCSRQCLILTHSRSRYPDA